MTHYLSHYTDHAKKHDCKGYQEGKQTIIEPASLCLTCRFNAQPPYKMRSAGTKWGIPPDSPASPADTAAARVDEPERDAQKVRMQFDRRVHIFLTWLPFQARDTGGKPLRHEQLPHSAVEVDGSQGAAQEPLVRKEATQRSKSVPVGTKKRGRGRSRVHGWGMGRFSMVDLGEFNVADEWGASDRMSA